MKNILVPFAALLILAGQTFAQEDKTITVSGKSTLQLSPNEIILAITFKEYWTDNNFTERVLLEDIERKLMDALRSAKVKEKNITHSAVTLLRDYDRNLRRYHNHHLSKTLSVCVYSADEIQAVIEALRQKALLGKAISGFRISDLRHTEVDQYKQQVKTEAIQNARANGKLIVEALGKKLGDIVTIKEVKSFNNWRSNDNNGTSFYSTANASGSDGSGVSPITITYELEAVFEIE